MEYLRAANALDESEPEPIVLVPNYMSLRSDGERDEAWGIFGAFLIQI